MKVKTKTIFFVLLNDLPAYLWRMKCAQVFSSTIADKIEQK